MINIEKVEFIQKIFEELKGGTDKWNHNYAYVYSMIPESISSIFEIGVDKGYSLLAWTRIFQHAEVFGIDTDPKVMLPDIQHNPRINIMKGDVRTFQTDAKFDVVIDDCLHDLDTISVAWYRFRDNFRLVYIIEDVRWDIVQQVYNLISSTDPKLIFMLIRTSDWKGDESFAGSDSNCVVVWRGL